MQDDQDHLDWLPQLSSNNRGAAGADLAWANLMQSGRHIPQGLFRAVLNIEDSQSSLELGTDVLLQAAIVVTGDRTKEGQLVAGVAVAWFEIIAQLERDPDFLFKIPWRKLEEIVAGAYERDGWPEVVLTPRSGDRGRDIIASRPGVGSIRIVDQIKAYKPGSVVTADEVRSILGVLMSEPNISKGLITTTSRFAPGIEKDGGLTALMPYRLELKNGTQLLQWLSKLGAKKPSA